MQGVVLLLAICIAGALVAALAVLVRWSRTSDERAGYYGRAVQRRHQEADADASTVAAILARSDRDALATIIDVLDRMAWAGMPVAAVEHLRGEVWALEFRDATRVEVRAGDVRALRRADALARRDALVVAQVHPVDDVVVVQLRTPHHAPLRVAFAV